MTGARSALIVATNTYGDQRLARLDAPARDAEELARVLGDPEIGGFEVTTVLDRPSHEVVRLIAQFFKGRVTDDLVLLHVSCHGLKDESGELYFATTDTRLDLLDATAVSSATVNRFMTRSQAGRVLVFVDCCYSGAFAKAMLTKDDGAVHLQDHLGGRGRAVVTASSAVQYAFLGDRDATDAAGGATVTQPSLFTRALVEGLSTGEADRDQDGWVSLEELYRFVHDEVTRANPDQTPHKWELGVSGDLRVARGVARSRPPLEDDPHPVEPPQPPPPPPRPSRPGKPGRRVALVGAAALSLLVLAVAGWLLTRGGGGHDDGGGAVVTAIPEDEVVTVQQVGATYRIVRVAPDGGTTTIVSGPGVTESSMPSLDGERDGLVYLAGSERLPHLVRSPAGDATDEPLFSDGVDPPCPGRAMSRLSWSPDATALTFVCDRLGVYRVDADGGGLVRLRPDDRVVNGPTWGGDGRIYFSRRSDGDVARIFSIPDTRADAPEAGPLVPNGNRDVDQRSLNWGEPGLLYVAGPHPGFDQRKDEGVKLLLADGTVVGLDPFIPDHVAWSPDYAWVMWTVGSPDAGPYEWRKQRLGDDERGRPRLEGAAVPVQVDDAVGSPAWGRR